jgi:hypothetical protein
MKPRSNRNTKGLKKLNERTKQGRGREEISNKRNSMS